METHTKFADSIWFTGSDALWVNLYIPSELRWRERGVGLRLETGYPYDGRVRITVTGGSGTFALKLRIPSWVRGRNAAVARVNGRAATRSDGGTYLTLDRTWRRGDVVDLDLPLDLAWLEAPDNPAVKAVAYGPLVLAGRMGSTPTPTIPVVDAGTLRRTGAHEWSLAVGDRTVALAPFLDVQHEHYNVYWAVPPAKRGPAIVAAYGFDEADGPATDASGRFAPAQLVDGAVREARDDGRAVALDGKGAHVLLPGGIPAGLDQLTVSVWARVDQLVNNTHVFNFSFNLNSYFFVNVRTGTNKARCALKLSGMEAEDVVDADIPFPTGAWTHLAVTLGADGGRFYLDGVLRGQNPTLTMSPLLVGATQHNYLGRSHDKRHPFLTGAVDDLRVFGRALTAAQVQALAAGRVPKVR
ncbi:LamG-like jellyroll fold domain-containing protein [Luteimicrobium sp. NPDC057192]|uniref:LamG-like jellyroll fold domain-containing protein n=1 Tax=Luteimicrobium sp. NPDC057192 TaxID=3346042 RepID=UPI00362BC61C